MNGAETQVILRPVNIKDRNQILNSWLHGQYWGNKYYKHMSQDVFFKEYANHITMLLSNPFAQIDVAVLSDDEDMILGYLVYVGNTVHWAFVKPKYRGQGIMNLLLKDKPFKHYTGATPPGHAIAQKLGLEFNPFITK